MKSEEYRKLISNIAKSAIKRRFPGLGKKEIDEAAKTIAVNIHARMYGANVDGVESPLWRDHYPDYQPTKPAQQILEEV